MLPRSGSSLHLTRGSLLGCWRLLGWALGRCWSFDWRSLGALWLLLGASAVVAAAGGAFAAVAAGAWPWQS